MDTKFYNVPINRLNLQYCVIVALVWLFIVTPTAAQPSMDGDHDAIVLNIIEQFEQNPSAQIANRFMKVIEEEELSDEPISFPANTHIDSLRQQVSYWAAEWHYNRQQYNLAEQYALKALPLYLYDGNDKSNCLNLLAIINVRKGDFTMAAFYAKQTLEIDMRSGDPDRISSSLNVLAGTYIAANNPYCAEKYILQGLEYTDRANNPARKAVLLGMASEVYHKLNNDSLALYYANHAYSLDSLRGMTQRLPVRLSQRAAALLGLKRYAAAEAAFRTAIAQLRENGNLHSLAIDLNQLGLMLLQQGRQADAIECYREAAKIFDTMGDLYNLVHSHRGLYEAYWDINRDSARIELERFNALKDSLYANATAESLARYSAEFDNTMLRAENKRSHSRLVIVVVVTIVILAAFVLVFRIVTRRHIRQIHELISRIEAIENAHVEGSKDIHHNTPISPSSDTENFLNSVIKELERGLSIGEIGVAQIAQRLNMSEQTFRRRIIEATGKSPKVFISAIQMERAVYLLTTNTQMPISEIAAQCGFSDAETFSRAFKRVYGCAPTHYLVN
ncbi:MAG: helix-turn-helix domain-containing protein [Muribaculaceae bacterium]